MSSELRWNPLTQHWIAIAPTRAARPVDGWDESEDTDATGSNCPFCPGNEVELPGILWELPAENAPGWSVRAVPNRFSAFSPGGIADVQHPARYAAGHQEVLIESPIHLDDFSTMSPKQLERVLVAYQDRYSALAGRANVSRVLIFRNRGKKAGNSLRHPHSQFIALELDPPEMQARETAFRTTRNARGGRCPLCDPDAFEPAFQKRLLHRGRHFRAWVPWAAEAPFEVWIVPETHRPDFGSGLGRGEERELAHILSWITRRYRDVAGDPDYNLLLHTAGPRDPEPEALHWWFRLRPRVGLPAGLELLTGVLVNPSSPDEDAAVLGQMARD